MKHSLPHAAALVLLALPLLPAPLSASTIFSDSFEGYSAGQTLPTGASPDLWATPPSGALSFAPETVTQDTGNLFHEGTGNHYLSLGGDGTSSSGYLASVNTLSGSGLGQTGQVSFSFDQTGTFSGGTNQGIVLRIGSGTAGNGLTAFAISLENGSLFNATGNGVIATGSALATYALNTVHSVSVVFNNSTSAYVYAGGTLAAGTAAIYFDGAYVGTEGDTLVNNATGVAEGTNIQNFNFTTKGNFAGSMLIDDVTGLNAAVVPEPSAALLLLGGAGLLFLRHRRAAVRA